MSVNCMEKAKSAEHKPRDRGSSMLPLQRRVSAGRLRVRRGCVTLLRFL